MHIGRGSLVAGLLVVFRGIRALNVSPSSPSDRPFFHRGGQAGENDDRDMGVAICVVGMMQHLEVTSKIENIVKPFEDRIPGSSGVFLALETGLLEQVVPGEKYENIRGIANFCRVSERTKTQVEKSFAPYLKTSKFVSHVKIPVIPARWPKLYAPKLQKNQTASASQQHAQLQQIGTTLGHMRFQRMCVNMIQEHEEARRGKYSVVMMVHESTLALRPVDPEKILSLRRLVLKDTKSMGFADDKVIVMPRKYLEGSLGGLFDFMLKVSAAPEIEPELNLTCSKFTSTEDIMHYSLRANNVPFSELGESRVGDAYLPFVTGSCLAGTHGEKDHWCVVADCKDRLPSKPWTANVSCGTKNRYSIGCEGDL